MEGTCQAETRKPRVDFIGHTFFDSCEQTDNYLVVIVGHITFHGTYLYLYL